MLRSVKELRDYTLAAEDGEIGRCKDFLFDDSAWTIRYMVADTGKWLPKRKVLISPVALGEPDWRSRLFRVTLTKETIEKSPPLESDAPVSLEFEREWFEHYKWSPYWYGGGIWGVGPTPDVMGRQTKEKVAGEDSPETPTHNLRSAQEVIRYYIQATDGKIGHVEDFIVDDLTWTIRYLVVDTRDWLPGKKVLVAPMWVSKIEWANGDVHVDLSRDRVKESPEYDPSAPVNRQYESRLYDYYGRPRYWE